MAAEKCPNPACDFRFDPAQCPPGAVLACPKCQLRFTLAEATAPAPAPAPDAPSDPAEPARPPRRRSMLAGLGGSVVAVGGVLVLLTVVAVGVGFALLSKRRGPDTTAAGGVPELRVPDKNFALKPPAGWERDPATQNALGATAVALKRTDAPPAWAALSVVDYRTRAPLQTELRTDALRHLDRVFVGVDRSLTFEPATLGGKPAERALFRGEDLVTNVRCAGEVYVLGFGGVGYWFFAWAAESDAAAVAPAVDDARAGFRVLSERDSWAPEAGARAVFRSVNNNSRFRLVTTDPAWAKAPGLDPKGHHPAAELLLKGVIKGKRDFSPEAFATVMVVTAAGDAQKQAETLLRAKYTPDPAEFGPSVIEPAAGDVQGQPAGPDEVPAGRPATRWQVRLTDEGASKSADKLVVFAHATVGPDLVIADANCPLDQRPIWERRLVDLVGSVGANE